MEEDNWEMSDEAEYERISKMSESELLDYVIEHPEYLTDPYYRGYDTAIYARHDALREPNESDKR